MRLYFRPYLCLALAALSAVHGSGSVSQATDSSECHASSTAGHEECQRLHHAGHDEIDLLQVHSTVAHRRSNHSEHRHDVAVTNKVEMAAEPLPVPLLIKQTLALTGEEDSSFLEVTKLVDRSPRSSRPVREDGSEEEDDVVPGAVRAVGELGVRELLRFPAVAEAVSKASGVHKLPEAFRILGRALVVASGCILMIGCVLLLLKIFRSEDETVKKQIVTEEPRKITDPWSALGVCLVFIVWEQISTDQYLPSMPQMMLDLDCSYAAISFTVSVVWVVKGVAALIIAPISDAQGRRTVILYCCGLLVISTLACGLAPSIYWFYAARVLHGIGESGIVVVAGVCRDLFDDPWERMTVMNAFGAALFAVPVVAPCFGGLLGAWIGWRWVFVVLSVGIFSSFIFLWVYLEETLVPNPQLGETYWKEVVGILGDRHMMCLVVVMALLLGLINFNDSNLSLILEDTYHISVIKTSLLVGANAAALLPGFALAEVGNNNRGPLATVRITSLVLLIPSYAMAMVGLFASNSPTAFMSSLYPFNCLFAPVIVGCMTLYQQPLKDTFAMASAIQLFFSTTLAALLVSLPGMELISFGHEVTHWCLWTSGVAITAVAVFWFGFGANPPDWAYEQRFPDEPEQEPGEGDIPETRRQVGT